MKNPAPLLLAAALLAAALLPAGCTSLGQSKRETGPAASAAARLGEAFTGRSHRTAGFLRTVVRQDVFSPDTAAFLYLHVLDARAGETEIACTLFQEGSHIKTVTPQAVRDGDAILVVQLTLAGCRACGGRYAVEIRVDGRLERVLSFSLLPRPDDPDGEYPASAKRLLSFIIPGSIFHSAAAVVPSSPSGGGYSC